METNACNLHARKMKVKDMNLYLVPIIDELKKL